MNAQAKLQVVLERKILKRKNFMVFLVKYSWVEGIENLLSRGSIPIT